MTSRPMTYRVRMEDSYLEPNAAREIHTITRMGLSCNFDNDSTTHDSGHQMKVVSAYSDLLKRTVY